MDMDTISKQSGFTLVELVIVIILLGILSIGVYINWPASTINLGGQANQLANDLRYTQALSMTTGSRYRLVIASSNTYQIVNSAGSAIRLAMGNTTMTLGSGISFGTLTNLPNNLVNFDGLGIPYSDTATPGTQLASTATIILTAAGENKTISITPQTGRVLVQ